MAWVAVVGGRIVGFAAARGRRPASEDRRGVDRRLGARPPSGPASGPRSPDMPRLGCARKAWMSPSSARAVIPGTNPRDSCTRRSAIARFLSSSTTRRLAQTTEPDGCHVVTSSNANGGSRTRCDEDPRSVRPGMDRPSAPPDGNRRACRSARRPTAGGTMGPSRARTRAWSRCPRVDHGARYTFRVACRTGWPHERDRESGTGAEGRDSLRGWSLNYWLMPVAPAP